MTVPTAAFSGSATAGGSESVALQYFDYGEFGPQGGHWDYINWRADDLGAAGYSDVWIQSPSQTVAPSSNGYDPRDHLNFNNALGSEGELQSMIDALNWNGVGTIVDTIYNHTGPEDPQGGTYPHFPNRGYFHEPQSIEEDRLRGQLAGLWALDHWDGRVTDFMSVYTDELAELGVSGLRLDAAVHIPQWWFDNEASDWWDWHGLFTVGEIWDPLWRIEEYLNGAIDTAFDFQLQSQLTDSFSFGGSLDDLRSTIENGDCLLGSNPVGACTFVENHDLNVYGDDPGEVPDDYDHAHAFILPAPGFPFVYENRTIDGDGIDDPYADWLANLIWIKNNLAGGDMWFRYSDDDFLVHERQGNLVTGINKSGGTRSEWVYTEFRNQTLNDYTGTMGDVWVNGDGWCNIEVPAQDWVCYAP